MCTCFIRTDTTVELCLTLIGMDFTGSGSDHAFNMMTSCLAHDMLVYEVIFIFFILWVFPLSTLWSKA